MGLLPGKIIDPPKCAITYCREDATTNFADLWQGDGAGEPAAVPVCATHKQRFTTWVWAQRVKPAPHQIRYAADLTAEWSPWEPLRFAMLLRAPIRRLEFRRLVNELGDDGRYLEGAEVTKSQGPRCTM